MSIVTLCLFLILGVSTASVYSENYKYDTDTETLEKTAVLGVGAIVGIAIGSVVCVIGCCVLICRCCCGCCQKKETYIHTTVISPQAQVPSTTVNLGYPYPNPTAPNYAPISQAQGNFGFVNQMSEQPPPQYTK